MTVPIAVMAKVVLKLWVVFKICSNIILIILQFLSKSEAPPRIIPRICFIKRSLFSQLFSDSFSRKTGTILLRAFSYSFSELIGTVLTSCGTVLFPGNLKITLEFTGEEDIELLFIPGAGEDIAFCGGGGGG